MSDWQSAVAPFPARFNLCACYLDRNLDEGRGGRVALVAGKASLGKIVPGYEAAIVGEDGREVPTGG
jgi:hypothetical protein